MSIQVHALINKQAGSPVVDYKLSILEDCLAKQFAQDERKRGFQSLDFGERNQVLSTSVYTVQ